MDGRSSVEMLDALRGIVRLLIREQSVTDGDELLDTEGVMTLLKIDSRHTLATFRKHGLPVVRLPGSGDTRRVVRFPRRAVMDWAMRYLYAETAPRKSAPPPRGKAKSSRRALGGGAWAEALSAVE